MSSPRPRIEIDLTLDDDDDDEVLPLAKPVKPINIKNEEVERSIGTQSIRGPEYPPVVANSLSRVDRSESPKVIEVIDVDADFELAMRLQEELDAGRDMDALDNYATYGQNQGSANGYTMQPYVNPSTASNGRWETTSAPGIRQVDAETRDFYTAQFHDLLANSPALSSSSHQ